MNKEESCTVTADEIREQYKKFVGRKILFIFLFTALIVGITGVSTSLGSADLSVWDAYSSYSENRSRICSSQNISAHWTMFWEAIVRNSNNIL